jgi:hypothetical protein
MTVADDNVHALRPYTDDQALAFLQANGGTFSGGISEAMEVVPKDGRTPPW